MKSSLDISVNRLPAALYREMLYLIEQGGLSFEMADAAFFWLFAPRSTMAEQQRPLHKT